MSSFCCRLMLPRFSGFSGSVTEVELVAIGVDTLQGIAGAEVEGLELVGIGSEARQVGILADVDALELVLGNRDVLQQGIVAEVEGLKLAIERGEAFEALKGREVEGGSIDIAYADGVDLGELAEVSTEDRRIGRSARTCGYIIDGRRILGINGDHAIAGSDARHSCLGNCRGGVADGVGEHEVAIAEVHGIEVELVVGAETEGALYGLSDLNGKGESWLDSVG